ncbi:hypothetical protein J3A83DRAFT_4210583 [Scleroderma citrinum]
MNQSAQSSSSNLPSRRTFGTPNTLGIEFDVDATQPSTSGRGGQSHSGSESQTQSRSGFLSRLRSHRHSNVMKSPTSERPPIPSALHNKESGATPLPILSMIVLSITMLGEFLTANVAMPFLLFMVKGFGEFEDEADIAFYTGVLVAAFFLTQFLTSLLWATVAERHGSRVVLTLSLFGSAVTVAIFGTSTSLRQAIVIRLLQGIFAGAVGVARGTVTLVTDITNEGRAYAILGFCWGLGGVAGAIIGGSFEHPAEKWPEVFGQTNLLVKYPYLLPCAFAGSITMIGSFLSLFLGRDGAPREGSIRLPVEKTTVQQSVIPEEDIGVPDPLESEPPLGFAASLKKGISNGFWAYLWTKPTSPSTADASISSVPLLSSPRLDRHPPISHTSRPSGSAYGYSGSYRARVTDSMTRGNMASRLRRGRTNYEGQQTPPEYSGLNFTQKLLLANENAVTNIADLWVAAAMNVDNEELFSDRETRYMEDGTIRGAYVEDRPVSLPLTAVAHGPSELRNLTSATANQRSTAIIDLPQGTSRHQFTKAPTRGSQQHSMATYQPSFGVRSIFSHPGVRTPSAVLDALSRSEMASDFRDPISDRPQSPGPGVVDDDIIEKPPSLASQLPIPIIIQYGLLALHSTTYDQVFLSYLVTDYQSGGLNLNPGHFSQLIALMCLAQIVYQFYLYPNIGYVEPLFLKCSC